MSPATNVSVFKKSCDDNPGTAQKSLHNLVSFPPLVSFPTLTRRKRPDFESNKLLLKRYLECKIWFLLKVLKQLSVELRGYCIPKS